MNYFKYFQQYFHLYQMSVTKLPFPFFSEKVFTRLPEFLWRLNRDIKCKFTRQPLRIEPAPWKALILGTEVSYNHLKLIYV